MSLLIKANKKGQNSLTRPRILGKITQSLRESGQVLCDICKSGVKNHERRRKEKHIPHPCADAAGAAASTAAAATGFSALNAIVASSGVAAGAKMVGDNISRAFNAFPQVFWSGGDLAKNAACEFAKMRVLEEKR